MSQEAIDQSAAQVAARRMNDHAGRLIHHQERFVLITYNKRNLRVGFCFGQEFLPAYYANGGTYGEPVLGATDTFTDPNALL